MANIVVISVDDLAHWIGPNTVYSANVHTPNLKRLAEAGVTFENAYTPEAICNPARTSTFTGQDPNTTGVHANDQSWEEFVDPAITYPAHFLQAGWDVAGYGKNLHPFNIPAAIHEQLFSHYEVLGGYRQDPPNTKFVQALPEGVDPDSLADHQTVNDAIRFLASQDPDKSFLLNLGLLKPHLDWIVPQEYFDLYPLEDIVVPGLVGDDMSNVPAFIRDQLQDSRKHPTPNSPDAAKVFMQGYLASVSYMDAELGRLLDVLDAGGNFDTTNIVLWSDHGYHLGDREGLWGKFTLWEEATKVPLIIKSAANDNPGTIVSDIVNLIDIYPTLTEMGGLTPPSHLEGDSLMPLVTGTGPANGDGISMTWMFGSVMMRTPQFAFMAYEDGSEELYDMLIDPDQLNNLALLPEFDGTRDALRETLVEKANIATGPIGTGQSDAFYLNQDGDIAQGLDGDDRYYVNADGVTICESPDEGRDIVYSTSSFALPDNVEDLIAPYYTTPDGIVLTGNGLNNVIIGSGSSEMLFGGAGDDTIRGGWGRADTIYGGDGNDAILGWVGADLIHGDSGNDIIRGIRGNDTIFGGEGDDTLIAGAGDNVLLYGGAGRDTLQADSGTAFLDGGAGADRLVANGGTGFASYRTATVGVRADMSDQRSNRGDAMGDSYRNLQGLVGSDHNDALTGDNADNHLIGMAGADRLLGKDGTDRAAYWASAEGVLADLRYIRFNTGDAMGDIYGSIEDLQGTAFADDLRGDSAANLLLGDAGNDTFFGRDGDDTLRGGDGDDFLVGNAGSDLLDGGSGHDWASYWNSAACIVADLQFTDLNQGDAAGDTYSSIEGLQGTEFDDDLRGNDLANLIYGGGSQDTLSGRGGDDTLQGADGDDTLVGGAGADRLQGGEGFDLASYLDSAEGVLADLARAAFNTGDAAGDIYSLIESLQGSQFNDDLRGDANANRILGGDGQDILLGRGGADILDGGTGTDRATYEDSLTGILADLGYAIHNTGDAAGDTFLSIEQVQGTQLSDDLRGDALANRLIGDAGHDTLYGRAGDDVLLGGAGNDILLGNTGADRIDGGTGTDRASYWNSTEGILADLATAGLNTGDAAGDSYSSIEDLQGTDFDDDLRGDSGANILYAGTGNDTLTGRDGNDRLFGGEGADSFVFSAGADVIRDFGMAEGDRLLLDVLALGLGGLTGAEIVATFADASPTRVEFDFGNDNRLTLEGLTDLTDIESRLFLF